MVERVTGELAVDLDRLVVDAVDEISARVPAYARQIAVMHAQGMASGSTCFSRK